MKLKTFLLLLVPCSLLLSPCPLQATDVIDGNCHYREIEGRYAGVRKNDNGITYTTFETDDRITLVYCLRIPRATVSATALLTPKVAGDITLNVRVKDRDAAMNAPEVAAATAEAEKFLAGNGRVLVRASGTEPLVRVLAEAPTDELCRQADDIVLKALEPFKA